MPSKKRTRVRVVDENIHDVALFGLRTRGMARDLTHKAEEHDGIHHALNDRLKAIEEGESREFKAIKKLIRTTMTELSDRVYALEHPKEMAYQGMKHPPLEGEEGIGSELGSNAQREAHQRLMQDLCRRRILRQLCRMLECRSNDHLVEQVKTLIEKHEVTAEELFHLRR